MEKPKVHCLAGKPLSKNGRKTECPGIHSLPTTRLISGHLGHGSCLEGCHLKRGGWRSTSVSLSATEVAVRKGLVTAG